MWGEKIHYECYREEHFSGKSDSVTTVKDRSDINKEGIFWVESLQAFLVADKIVDLPTYIITKITPSDAYKYLREYGEIFHGIFVNHISLIDDDYVRCIYEEYDIKSNKIVISNNAGYYHCVLKEDDEEYE